ncbi:hypothetical protein TNCV_1024741 [Trichonephila clavipes]|nr:hypothetical protein TNCV_1024741 [Trichonephila clavipes]
MVPFKGLETKCTCCLANNKIIMNEIETAKQELAMDQTVMLSTKWGKKMKEKNDLIQREKDILKSLPDVLKTKEDELN